MLIKANKCLFVLRSLRKEGFSPGEVDHLFSALVLPNFTYGLPVYGAIDSDLTVIQTFMDRCFKRKYTSTCERMDIRELLEKADKKIFKVRSVDPHCPLSDIRQSLTWHKVLNAVVAELGISEGIKQDASILCYSEFRA